MGQKVISFFFSESSHVSCQINDKQAENTMKATPALLYTHNPQNKAIYFLKKVMLHTNLKAKKCRTLYKLTICTPLNFLAWWKGQTFKLCRKYISCCLCFVLFKVLFEFDIIREVIHQFWNTFESFVVSFHRVSTDRNLHVFINKCMYCIYSSVFVRIVTWVDLKLAL